MVPESKSEVARGYKAESEISKGHEETFWGDGQFHKSTFEYVKTI